MSYKVSKSILSLCAGLNRLDAIVFTGGIGENSHRTRLHICDHLKVLGVDLDHHANEEHGAQNRGIISMPASPVVCVVPTDEESLIAMDTVQLLSDNR
jgi:acetate kinase